VTREAVVAEAETWLGTPYHSGARIKGVGVDCAMILAAVFEAAGVIPHVDPGTYAADFGLHRDEEVFLGWVERYGYPVEKPQAGDVALFVYGRCFSHGAIMTSATGLIHAVRRDGMVSRGDLADTGLAEREVRFFTLWPEVTDGR
jgi:cell wall-associated NlpC family hydrolase